MNLTGFSKARMAWLIPGFLLVLLGIFMPQGWYQSLPRDLEVAAPPIKGITLLQVSFVVQGIILCLVSVLNWRFSPLDKNQLLAEPQRLSVGSDVSRNIVLVVLAGITVLALALRLVNLNSDLWLDEISTVVVYGPMSLLEVVGGYINFNNHLLNTLLVKLSVGVFGESAWAVRLPVVLLGTATIPAAYLVARQLGFSRELCLGIALIVAVSYHHIFFSQNARGYIGHVFFTLLASGLLIRALQTDRPRTWILYVAVMFLNFATLLTSAYVLIAHGIVGLVALYMVKRRGGNPLPLFRRLFVVFGLVGFLAFQLYALILPYAFVRAQAKYTGEGGYFSLFSTDLLAELVRGLSAGIGIGSGPLALLVLTAGAAVAGVGFIVLLRKNWALTLGLSLPVIISILVIIVNGLTFSPRFMLPALPVAIFSVVQGVYSIAEFVAAKLPTFPQAWLPRLAAAVLVVGVLGVSILSLKYYYSVPKQSYTASIEYVEEQRAGGEMVIVADLAEQGYRYYGSPDYHFVQSVDDLDRVLSNNSDRSSFVVTTLPRFLHLRKPELEARIQQDWLLIRSFPGSIGGGQVDVWIDKGSESNISRALSLDSDQ